MAYVVDKNLKSWVAVSKDSDFPIQNLPYGIFSVGSKSPCAGIAIGDKVLDLSVLSDEGFFKELKIVGESVFHKSTLNDFIALGKPIWTEVRKKVAELLSDSCDKLRNHPAVNKAIVDQAKVSMHLPVAIGDYIDFYSSMEHATNVGKMFRDPANALLPNWKHLPVGYHGRASSVIVSGVDFHRPMGQSKGPNDEKPSWGPSKQLDFELEVGFICGKNNPLGKRVSTHEAEDFIFGLVLVNDWSARDIQSWEYVPLGPFLGKSFATSISPWVVPLDALEPFRVASPKQDVEVLPYLKYEGERSFDIELTVDLLPQSNSSHSTTICKSNFKYMYWNMAQQIAHQTSNGTNIRIGDLYASGTISGSTEDSYGSMLELSWRGTKPLKMKDDSTRSFILDNDTVVIKGIASKDGVRIGFGEVKAKVLPPL